MSKTKIQIDNLEIDTSTALRIARCLEKHEPVIWKAISKELSQALRIHDVVESVCDNCKPRSGFFPGVTCPKCGKPFRQIKQNVR